MSHKEQPVDTASSTTNSLEWCEVLPLLAALPWAMKMVRSMGLTNGVGAHLPAQWCHDVTRLLASAQGCRARAAGTAEQASSSTRRLQQLVPRGIPELKAVSHQRMGRSSMDLVLVLTQLPRLRGRGQQDQQQDRADHRHGRRVTR